MAKKKKEVEKARVEIIINDEGAIKIDTNLSALGAIHIMAQAQQVIIQRQLEDSIENAQPTEEQ